MGFLYIPDTSGASALCLPLCSQGQGVSPACQCYVRKVLRKGPLDFTLELQSSLCCHGAAQQAFCPFNPTGTGEKTLSALFESLGQAGPAPRLAVAPGLNCLGGRVCSKHLLGGWRGCASCPAVFYCQGCLTFDAAMHARRATHV